MTRPRRLQSSSRETGQSIGENVGDSDKVNMLGTGTKYGVCRERNKHAEGNQNVAAKDKMGCYLSNYVDCFSLSSRMALLPLPLASG